MARSKEELKRDACQAIDKNREAIFSFADSIFQEPELGYREVKTADKFTHVLKTLGYSYRDHLAITGVVSRQKGRNSMMNVALMGEMDAILVPGHPQCNPDTGAAHACGHHCMMAGLAGAAYAIRDACLMEELDGDISLMAVPGEEFVELEYRNRLREEGKISFLSGKQEFIALGLMDDVDALIMQHIYSAGDSPVHAMAGNHTGGFVGKLIQYTGKAAHAGTEPFNGINALNAAEIGLAAIHAQRETFRDEDHIRVHPIITKGGDLVNVVPADVRLETYVRGETMDAILKASEKVNRALKAGAYAVGASCRITELPGYLPVRHHLPLDQVVYENLCSLFGRDHAECISSWDGGYTDAGNISHLLPVVHAYIAASKGGMHCEDYEIIDKETAYLTTAKLMIMSAIDLLADGAQKGLDVTRGFTPAMTKEDYLSQWGGMS